MAISVICRFAGDGLQVVDDRYADLGEAVLAALRLADDYGIDRADGRPPSRIDVCVDARIELAITVIAGGLLGHRQASGV